MGDVIKFKRPSARAKNDGRTLCGSGFHKWKTATERRFDVKQGKLVTIERCERCGKTRTRLT
jgi:hypothetical protein